MGLLSENTTGMMHLHFPIETFQQKIIDTFQLSKYFNVLYYSGEYLQASVKKYF